MRVAINGAGVAGPALAYWLHRGGHEVVLIEKAPRFRTGGYLIDFWGVGYTVAERMGILADVRKAGYSVREMRLVDGRGRKAGLLDVDIFRRLLNDRYTSLPRGALAATIYRTIEGRVESIFGNSISGIEQRAADVYVSFEHGAAREFDLVVGADGLHSTVRKLVFGPESQFEKQLGYWVAAFEVEGYRPCDELVYVAYSAPGRQVGRFSLRDDRTLFLFVFAVEHMIGPEPHDLEQRKELLHRIFGNAGWECPQILQAMDRVESIYFDRASQIRMDSWSNDRVVLIGDAAACLSLLAAEGTGLALTEAYVLAGELRRAGDDYREAFRRYEQQLRPFIESKQATARSFGGAFAPRTWMGIWLRNQVIKLAAIPPLARFFARRMLTDRFQLPEYKM
jgi:2-polyprenyl-6-methoxyphenol hydroxylase-like FAD-dependent oxidoreductase